VTGRAGTLWILILVLVRRREEAESEESRGSESGFGSEEEDGERCGKEGRGENVADDALMRWTMDRTSAEPSTRSSKASCFCSSTGRLDSSLLLAPAPGPTAAASGQSSSSRTGGEWPAPLTVLCEQCLQTPTIVVAVSSVSSSLKLSGIQWSESRQFANTAQMLISLALLVDYSVSTFAIPPTSPRHRTGLLVRPAFMNRSFMT